MAVKVEHFIEKQQKVINRKLYKKNIFIIAVSWHNKILNKFIVTKKHNSKDIERFIKTSVEIAKMYSEMNYGKVTVLATKSLNISKIKDEMIKELNNNVIPNKVFTNAVIKENNGKWIHLAKITYNKDEYGNNRNL